MIRFPVEFIATKYPGYFWNMNNKTLYSIKTNGILTPMKKHLPSKWSKIVCPYYQVSVKGCRKYLTEDYLLRIKNIGSIIPVKI